MTTLLLPFVAIYRLFLPSPILSGVDFVLIDVGLLKRPKEGSVLSSILARSFEHSPSTSS